VKRVFVFFLNLLIVLTSLSAKDQEIVFAVPDSGLITLGVFDRSGKLVRLLHDLDGDDAFRIGLNGYATSWDGLNDDGEKLPPGHYHIRGYLVGDAKVEGEAIHFNDWITDDTSPRLKRIHDFRLISSGDLLFLAHDQDDHLLCTRYSNASGFLWVRDLGLDSDRAILAINSASVFVACTDSLRILSLTTGEIMAERKMALSTASSAIAATDNTFYFTDEKGLHVFELPSFAPLPNRVSPVPFDSLDANAQIILGSSSGVVYLSQENSSFETVALPGLAQSLSLGREKSLWFADAPYDPTAKPVVAQSDFSGNILCSLNLDIPPSSKIQLSACKNSEAVAFLISDPNGQRLGVVSRSNTADWVIEWEKSIVHCTEFSFHNNVVKPVAGKSSDLLNFRLDLNPLTDKRDQISLGATFDESGTHLVTPDGLPIVLISDSQNIKKVAIDRGKTPDSIRFLQGDDTVVEEFKISGLNHIIPINAGGIDLP